LAGAHADITVLRLEVSRLRGAVPRAGAGADDGGGASCSAAAAAAAAASPRRRGGCGGASSATSAASAEASASSAARVQAAVQAQLRALRFEDSQRAACPVCMRDDVRKDTALGCGHVFCAACAAALHTCALCRAPIALRVHLY
jgi:E3 ubiquitin-protein ligase RGLG